MNNITFLAWGVGTGKTKEALDRATEAGCDKIIVFAPSVLKTMKHWEREAKKWHNTIPMEVYTYYRLQQYGKGDIEHKLYNQGHKVAIIFDEAHKLKNSQSLQGLGAFKLVRDNPKANVYLLSGTPAPNGYHDFCNYAKMTSFVRNKSDFYNTYVIQTNYRGFPEIKGYQRTKDLDYWWSNFADTKPPVVYTKETDISVDFPIVFNEIYAKKTRVGKMNGESKLLENASQLTHYCRQIVSMAKVRQDWLENFLESTDENVVVFTSYKTSSETVVSIAKKLDKKVYRVDGETKTLPEDSELATLRNAVIVVNYQAGGAGLNLQFANHAVFFTPTYSYSDYVQARGRISRRGQEKTCYFYHLQAERSIEVDVYKCLKKKEDFSEKLWSEQYKLDEEEDIDIIKL